MNLKFSYFIILLIVFSCNKYDGPSHETTKSYSFSFYGNELKTMAGEYFTDSIRLYANGYENGIDQKGLTVVLIVESGGGHIDNSNLEIVNGYAATKWKAGNQGGLQQIRADVYKQNGQYLGSAIANAYAFRKGAWDMTQNVPDVLIADVVADTINKKTYMITGYGLFVEKDYYFNWEQLGYQQINPYSLDIDKSGNIYMTTWQGQILRKASGTDFWSYCNNPIPGNSQLYNTTICNNGYIYTTSPNYDKSLRCSRDGGYTWTADTAGLIPGETVGNIYKLSNGEFIFQTSGTNLYKSTDDGKSWNPMQGPTNSTKLYVTKNEDIILFNQENGVSIFKSTDLGKSFKKVYSISFYYGPDMSKIIQQKGGWYYILIPGYGIIRTTDFEQFETFWQNSDVLNLYQTHDGVLISKGYSNYPVYYYRE